jgi:hypothetical protein
MIQRLKEKDIEHQELILDVDKMNSEFMESSEELYMALDENRWDLLQSDFNVLNKHSTEFSYYTEDLYDL